MTQCPVPKPVLKAPPALYNPPGSGRAGWNLAPAHETSPEAANAKTGRAGKTPSLLPQTGKCSFPYNGERKTAGNKEKHKYELCPAPSVHEGEEDGSGWAAWEPLLGHRILRGAAGTAGGVWGTQRDPSHLRALMRSLLQPWKSSLPWLKPRKHLGLDHRHPGWKPASGKHN